MVNSDAASKDELPLSVRKKAKNKKSPKKVPVKRIRKKKVRNLPAEKPIECPDCGLRFHFLSKLKNHQRHHTGEKPYECDVCQKTFSQSYSLKTHKFIHSNEKPFKCNFCAYACRDSSTLRKHHYRHMGIVQKYNCNVCAKSFTLKYLLKSHVAEAHLSVDLRTHKCDRCDKKFKTKGKVKLHVKLVHDRVRATTCPICNKFLSNSGNLKNHLVSHVQEKPYMCGFPGCDKRYKDKNTLAKHSIVHRPDKQYSCSECGYLFTRRVRLRNHMLKVHQRTKCVECDYCGQKFYSKNYLIIHIGKKHNPRTQQYICDMCGYRAKNKPGMVMHVKFVHDGIRNDVHCNLCRKTYKKHEYLKMHYKKTHNIAYKTYRDQRQKLEGINENIKIKTEPIDSDDETPNDLQIKVNDLTDQTGNEKLIKRHQVKDPKGTEGIKNTDQTGTKGNSSKGQATPSQSTQLKVHKCEICGRFFKKLPRLKNHLVKVHARTKCVSCEQCGQKFYSKNYLIDHMYKRHMHKQEHICDECGFKTYHKPGIVLHIKFAHATTAVQCDICKKKYKKMDLLQFHYSEAHGTSYNIATNNQEGTVENVKVKVESLNSETEAIDLFKSDNQEISDRSLTRDGSTSLKGLIERSGVRSVPENIFEEFCSGHIEYLPAGAFKERGESYTKDPLSITDKKLETQAAANINKLLCEARRERAKEKLERARQMYNERIKKILEAKKAAKLLKFNRKNVNKHKNYKQNETEKASQNNTKITLSDKPITTLGNNSYANNSDDDGTKYDAASDVTYISDVEDESNTQTTKEVVNKDDDDNLITLLEELNQMTEPDASNKIYLEGKEMTIEDVLAGDAGEDCSRNECIEELLENRASTDDTYEERAKDKDNNNSTDVENESNEIEITNKLEVVNVTNESSKTDQGAIISGENDNEKSSTNKLKEVLLTEHAYAKSEKTRQIELEFLQCPEKLFDKSFDTSEEDRLNSSDNVNGNFTLLDNDKPCRKQTNKVPKKKVQKKPSNKHKEHAVYGNLDSTTPLASDIPKRTGKKRRKQLPYNKDSIADQELPLIFKAKKNSSKEGNGDRTATKVLATNVLPDAKANNNLLSDEISVKHKIDWDSEVNDTTKDKTEQQSTWSFKYKVLIEEVLRSFETQEVNDEDLNEEKVKTALNKKVIALLKQTQRDAIENKATDNENVQERILIGKLKDIASSQSGDLNSLIAELLKSIDEMFSERSDDNSSSNLTNSLQPHKNSYNKNDNTSKIRNKNGNVKDLPNSSIVTDINTSKTTKKCVLRNKRKGVLIQKHSKKSRKAGLNICNELSDRSGTRNCDDNIEEVTIKSKGRKIKIKDQNVNDPNAKIDSQHKNSNGNEDAQKDCTANIDIPLKRSSRKIKLNRKYFEESDDGRSEDSGDKVSNTKDKKREEKRRTGKVTFNTHQCYVCFKVFETKAALIEHCKTHFSVDREKSLKICPLCDYTCTSGFTRHVKKVHDITIKLPYARIQEELVAGETKYYFDINDPKIKRVDVIPSLKNLNRRAMVQLDKEHREKDAKTIVKHKLVKKGNEWVIEKEEMSLDDVVLPEFDKHIDVSDKISDTNDYFDSLKKLYHVSKKAGKKMMFPCQHCDKICQNLGALKLHNRKHEDNPAPFAPKVWKHKATNSQIRKATTDKRAEAKKKKKLTRIKLKGVDKSNIEDVLEKDNRKTKPKPIKSNHRCDPQLQEFYRNNIRGGDIEFWQFLKIFNKMDRDNINDFKDLQGKYNYGIINTDMQREILEDNFILQVGNSNEGNLAENSKNYELESQDLGNDNNESCATKSKKSKTNIKSNRPKNCRSNKVKKLKSKKDRIVSGSERDFFEKNLGNDIQKDRAIDNIFAESQAKDLANDSNTSCSSNSTSVVVSNKTDDGKQIEEIVKKFSVEERKKRAIEIVNEIMQH